MRLNLLTTIALTSVCRYVETEWDNLTSEEKYLIHQQVKDEIEQAEEAERVSALGPEISFSEHALRMGAERDARNMLDRVREIEIRNSKDINKNADVEEKLERVNDFIQTFLPGCTPLSQGREGLFEREVGDDSNTVAIAVLETLAPKDRRFKVAGLRFRYRNESFEVFMAGQQVLDSSRILKKLEEIDEGCRLVEAQKVLEEGLNELIKLTSFRHRSLAKAILPRGKDVALDISNLRLTPEVAACILETIAYALQ